MLLAQVCLIRRLHAMFCYSPTLSMTRKNLGVLYKRQGKLEAASMLENMTLQLGPIVCHVFHFFEVLC